MKKIAILAMTGILALTAVGFGFAKWSSTVNADVTVNTGTLLVGIRDVGTNDDGKDVGVKDYGVVKVGPNLGNLGADPQWGLGINSEMKDVAKLESVNITPCTPVGAINGVDYYSSISESMTNAYPYYGPSTEVEIANLGSIPVKLETFDWKWTSGTINDENFIINDWAITLPGGNVTTGNGMDTLYGALNKLQLHAKEVVKVRVQMGITQKGVTTGVLTPQNASGTAQLTVTASQWNEVQ